MGNDVAARVRCMICMKVRTVAKDQQGNPVLLLVDKAETLALPLWIGTPEAEAIARELATAHAPSDDP